MNRLFKLLSVCLVLGFAAFGEPSREEEDDIEIRATGVWAVAGENAVIEAKATSPEGEDLSGLHWCLCDASGAVVMSWKPSVAGRTKRLKMNMPAGAYRLRATDGTRFCGDVPVNVLRRDNPHLRDGALSPAEVHEPPDRRPESGARRFWRDVNRMELSHPDTSLCTPRRSVVRLCEADAGAFDADSPDALADLIDRTAARMKHAAENVIAFPGFGHRTHDVLSAWYAKFDCEGLSICPVLVVDAAEGSHKRSSDARRHLDHQVDALLDQGAPHRSFKGVCLDLTRCGGPETNLCARLARKLAERRSDLVLWPLSGQKGGRSLRDVVAPLRDGDASCVFKAVGSEETDGAVVPFAQAFRALPAVAFDDVGAVPADGVRLRQKEYGGTSWFYVLNTASAPVRVKLEVPTRTRDLVADGRVGGLFGASTLELVLKPCELRAYAAAEGLPRRVD